MFKNALATALANTMIEKASVTLFPAKQIGKYIAGKVLKGAGKGIPKLVWKAGKLVKKYPTTSLYTAMGAAAGAKGVGSFMRYPYA